MRAKRKRPHQDRNPAKNGRLSPVPMTRCSTCVITLSRVVNIRLYFLGFALVTDWENDHWVEDLRKAMFASSREEYWFLSRHLWRNWWWISPSKRKRLIATQPEAFRPFSGLVKIPKWELADLERKSNEVLSARKALAQKCFDTIIDGVKSVPGTAVKKFELVQFLIEQRDGFVSQILDDFK